MSRLVDRDDRRGMQFAIEVTAALSFPFMGTMNRFYSSSEKYSQFMEHFRLLTGGSDAQRVEDVFVLIERRRGDNMEERRGMSNALVNTVPVQGGRTK